MRTITIEVEGMNEDKVIDQLVKAARKAAKEAGNTYVMCSTEAPAKQKLLPDLSVPSFVRRGKSERMGVAW